MPQDEAKHLQYLLDYAADDFDTGIGADVTWFAVLAHTRPRTGQCLATSALKSRLRTRTRALTRRTILWYGLQPLLTGGSALLTHLINA